MCSKFNVQLLLSESFKRSCYHILQVFTLHEKHRENCQVGVPLLVDSRDLLLDSSPLSGEFVGGRQGTTEGTGSQGELLLELLSSG